MTPSQVARQAVNYAMGETHYKSKLSDSGIANMRYLLSLGTKGRKVAEIFGVSEKYVSSIKNGRSRKT